MSPEELRFSVDYVRMYLPNCLEPGIVRYNIQGRYNYYMRIMDIWRNGVAITNLDIRAIRL